MNLKCINMGQGAVLTSQVAISRHKSDIVASKNKVAFQDEANPVDGLEFST